MTSFFFLIIGCFLVACSPIEKLRPLGPGQIYVERGDTVYSIADAHKVSIRELVSLNRLRPPYILKAGQILLLPESSGKEDLPLLKEGPQLLSEEETAAPSFPPQKRWEPSQTLSKTEFTESPFQRTSNTSPSSSPYLDSANSELLEEVRYDVCGAISSSTTGKNSSSFSSLEKKEIKKNSSPMPPLQAANSLPSDMTTFCLPVSGGVFKKFGEKGDDGKKCQGVRLNANPGENVQASADGKVLFAGNELGGQNIVVLQHPGGWLTAYGPLRRISVSKGQTLLKRHILGCVAGKVLYFEMRLDRKPIDPLRYAH